jgi:PPE family
LAVRVDPQALTSHALGLAGSHVSTPAPICAPPAADPVSLSAVAVLQAHGEALAAVVEHSGALRAHGGASLVQTAASLQGTDEDNGALIAAVLTGPATAAAGGMGPVLAPSVGAPPAGAVIPPIPAMALAPPLPGEQWSQLLWGGAGSGGLGEFADAMNRHGATLDDVADRVQGWGRGIDEQWVDGRQQAGANTIQHGKWLRDSATQARTVAAAAHDVAEVFDSAKYATPTPEEFGQARQWIAQAQAAGDPVALSAAASHFADLQADALRAAGGTYQPGVQAAVTTLGTPLQTAPPIAHGGGIQATDYHFKDDPPPPPKIDGPGTAPQIEGPNTKKQDDLDSSSPGTGPGTGIALGGDGGDRGDGRPRVRIPPNGANPGLDGLNPIPHPHDARAIPTGTAIGPNGERYGFYAIVPYHNPDGSVNEHYTASETEVVDLAHPDQVLYTLPISQASGAFDPASGRMNIVGNDPQTNDRGLWQSAPVGQNPSWGNTLQSSGTFQGKLNGGRESQIVALPNGKGFMLVGSADEQPIEGAVASTPEGLLTAPAQDLLGPLPDGQFPYGPTITEINEVDGKEIVTMRVSTFGIGTYDPHTYTTTFPVIP